MKYFKKGLLRGLLGIPLGVFVGVTITLIAAGINRNTTVNIYSLFLSLVELSVLGYVLLSCSIIFSIENWSRLKQLITYVIILIVLLLPTFIVGSCTSVVYVDNPFVLMIPALLFLLAFLAVFFCFWLGFYFYWRHKIKIVNSLLQKK